MMTKSLNLFVLLLIFLGANHVTCEVEINPAIGCGYVDTSRFVNQTKFVVKKTSKPNHLSSGIRFIEESPEKCHLQTGHSHSMRIELERLSRIHRIGISKQAISDPKKNFEITVGRDESQHTTTTWPCTYSQQASDDYHAYFVCEAEEKSPLVINFVKIQLKIWTNSLDVNLKLGNPTSTWMFLVDYSCKNVTNYPENHEATDCTVKTCRRPRDIENGQWHYVNDSSYTQFWYSCNEQFQIEGDEGTEDDNGKRIATCNAATNNWENLRMCESITTPSTETQTTAEPSKVVTSASHNNSEESHKNPLIYVFSGVASLVFIISVACGVCIRKRRASLANNDENTNSTPSARKSFESTIQAQSVAVYV